MSGSTSERYDLFSTLQTKQLTLVVKIEGLADVLSSAPIKTRVLYGDEGIYYGGDDLVYGGLRPYVADDGSTYRSLLSLEGSSLTLSQKLEPESGRASISTLTLAFVDKDGFMTELISPGVMLDEILGKTVEVFMGYADISYPHDYVRIFRGFVGSCDSNGGTVTIQLSDPNLKRRRKLFYTAKTKLTSSVTSGSTSFPVASADDFYSPIIGPDGGIDSAVKCYFKIGDEWIRGQPSGATTLGGYLDPNTLSPVNPDRGERGTAAASHASGAEVTAGVEISDNAVEMALKIMLSGWDGPWITDVALLSLGEYPDPDPYVNTTNEIYLPSKVDAKRDYGLTIGDYVSLTGSVVSGGANDLTDYRIIGFSDFEDQTNRIIIVTGGTLYKEGPTPATASFRSQFDTYPVACGLKLTPRDVDVDRHLYLRDTFFGVSGIDYTFFIIDTEESGKTFLEEQVYRPVGMYSLTRRGLLSCGYSKPPLADSDLIFLDADNILNPNEVKPSRAVNGRSFYNEINFSFDEDDEGNFTSIYNVLDSESLSLIGITQTLKIESRGLKTANDAPTYLDRIARGLLSRFKRGMVVLPMKVSWGAGSTIEAGDVVAVRDDGDLKIPNFETGERNSGTKLYEVLERSLDIKSGNVSLKLSRVVGADITNRYGIISPSSLIASGSTTSRLVIEDSFGAIYEGDEPKKWENFIGQKILVHSEDFSDSEETTLLGFDEVDPYVMLVEALSFTPASGYIIDIANYPTSTDPLEAEAYKQVFAFLTPTIAITSGVSSTVFEVGSGDIAKFYVGAPVRVHNEDYTVDSGEENTLVTAIDTGTNQVTVDTSLGFTPSTSEVVDLVGFSDEQGPYRFI